MRTLLLLLAILCLRYFLVELLQPEHSTDAPVEVVELHVQEVAVGRQLVVACRANRILVCMRLGLWDQRSTARVSPTLAGALALLEGRVGRSLSQPEVYLSITDEGLNAAQVLRRLDLLLGPRHRRYRVRHRWRAASTTARSVRSSGFYPWTLPARLRHATSATHCVPRFPEHGRRGERRTRSRRAAQRQR